jgi:hypothetical protein
VDADLRGIDGIGGPQAHLLPDPKRNAISFCPETAPKTHLICPATCCRC